MYKKGIFPNKSVIDRYLEIMQATPLKRVEYDFLKYVGEDVGQKALASFYKAALGLILKISEI
jgi:hypothetical protein